MKFKHFIFIPALALIFLVSANLPQDNAKKEQVLIETILAYIRQLHFQPQGVNDQFSERVYDLHINRMDGTKRFYTKKDIEKLEKYRLGIDEQSSMASYEFFDLSVKLWEQRLREVNEYYEDILSEPMNFTKKEDYETSADKREYAKNSRKLKDVWRKSLKYQVMSRLTTMLDAEEKKGDDEEKIGYDELEKKARAKVLKTHKDLFHRLTRMDRTKHLSSYINSISSASDPHTNYFAPKDKQDFDISISGRLEGIGARLMEEGIYIKVTEIVPGSPSWKQGDLKAGDLILAVAQGDKDAVDVVDMPIDDAVQMIRGKKGTKVNLTVKKVDGTKQIIPIIRDVVVTEEGYAKSSILMDDDFPGMKIGFIHLPKFYTDFTGTGGRTCSEDVKKEVIKLKKEAVDGIVIDLRFNGGGSLQDVVDMSGLFVKEGPMVQVKSRGNKPYTYDDDDVNVLYKGPLMIMVNEYSASASEIMAAALQDYGRAVIVGSEHTFGKGTVQRFFDLDRIITEENVKPLGSIKMTIQKFYRVNGTTTQLQGVKSDIVLPNVYKYIEVGEKEEEYPLEWDKIEPAEYVPSKTINAKILADLKKKSTARVSNNPTFTLIEENAKFLKDRRAASTYSLNLEQFRKLGDEMESTTKKFDKIRAEIPSLHVTNCKADGKEMKKNEKFKVRIEEWHKGIVKDIQLDETMAIMNDLIKYKPISKN
ncbi:MAG: carboxy terminal-processing peptidase [Saprospiraceae bacterium]